MTAKEKVNYRIIWFLKLRLRSLCGSTIEFSIITSEGMVTLQPEKTKKSSIRILGMHNKDIQVQFHCGHTIFDAIKSRIWSNRLVSLPCDLSKATECKQFHYSLQSHKKTRQLKFWLHWNPKSFRVWERWCFTILGLSRKIQLITWESLITNYQHKKAFRSAGHQTIQLLENRLVWRYNAGVVCQDRADFTSFGKQILQYMLKHVADRTSL